VVRIAVARRVLSTSETARFAERGSVRQRRGRLTRLSEQLQHGADPKEKRGATAFTLRGFARGRVSTGFPREQSEWCVLPPSARQEPWFCIRRLRTCFRRASPTRQRRALDSFVPSDSLMNRVSAVR
jgi:hypothetical protein